MSSTHEIRTQLDSKLDLWEKYLERIEAQVTETKEEAFNKYADAKVKLIVAIEKAKVEIAKIPDLAKEKKEQLLQMLNELLAKLKEKTGEAKDKFGTQKEDIKAALKKFEEKAKTDIGNTYQKMLGEFSNLGNTVHAHLDALEVRYEVERKKKTEQFDEQKKEFTEKVNKWKAILHENRAKGMDKFDGFEKDFMVGVNQINIAFRNLFAKE